MSDVDFKIQRFMLTHYDKLPLTEKTAFIRSLEDEEKSRFQALYERHATFEVHCSCGAALPAKSVVEGKVLPRHCEACIAKDGDALIASLPAWIGVRIRGEHEERMTKALTEMLSQKDSWTQSELIDALQKKLWGEFVA